jgi:hypothetical protein
MSTPLQASDVSPTIDRGVDIQEVSTYVEIASKGQSVRELLSDLGIRLHRDSALSVLLREADRVARDFACGRPLHSKDALIHAAHANRVASAILAVGREPGALECLRRMTGGVLNLLERSTSAGKDALWEIELIGKLRMLGLPAEPAEPDIVIKSLGERYPVSCKKVHSERGVEAQMRKAVKQLERFGAPGLVAFNIDDLTPARSVFVSPNARAAGDRLAELNRAFVDRHQRVLERFVVEGRCHAVLITTSVVADLMSTEPRLNTFSQTTIWTLSDPHGPTSPAFTSIVRQLRTPAAA